MKRATLFVTSLGTATALLFPGCSDLPPGQAGPFTDGAVAGGQMARATTVTSAEALATGSTTGTVAAAAIVILAKHKATPHQRQVALSRAKVAVAKLQARSAAAKPPKSGAAKKSTAKAAPSAKPLPRYIAVDTAKDEHTAPQAQKAVVIFDTETQEIVGNNVYDVKSTPPVGGTAKFETYTAEYVGSGS